MLSKRQPLWRLVIVAFLLAALLSGCGDKDKKSDEPKSKSYTIGVLVQSASTAAIYDGFKARMVELGYIEGQNVTYLYDGPAGTIDALKPAAEKLKSQNPDLVLAVATPATQAAKEVFADTNVPIIFAPIADPVALGLVANYQEPGGNLTGVVSTDTIAKALEWLLKIVPDAKRIYVPNNPADSSSVQSLQTLTDAADVMGVELVVSEGTTAEELDTITKTIPEDVDAVYVLRSGSLGAKTGNLVAAANALLIPIAASDIGLKIDQGVMVGYGPSYVEMGKQVARLGDLILKGTSPAVLPVENAEVFLGLNLQTAQTIGIEIPDAIVNQAKQIVRPPA
jgi:putative tryptophan/tyrosine transport system substrate-binding protein